MKSDIQPTKFLLDFPKDMNINNTGNEKNFLNLPYKLCAIKGQKLKFLEFWLWNENTKKLHRKRKECPQGENFNKWFKEKSSYVNDALRDGYRVVLNPVTTIVTKEPQTYTIVEAIDKINVLRANGIVGIMSETKNRSFTKRFVTFLESQNLHEKPVNEILKKDIQNYVDTFTFASITKNSHISFIKAIFNNMLDRDWISTNPAKTIKKFKEIQTNSTAISTEHQKELKILLIAEDTELYIFCMFIFYTFLRPIELRKLLVKQVDLETRKINISGKQSKNSKTDYIMISETFAKILIEYKFLERDGNEPLFSGNEDLKYSRNKFSKGFSEIRDKYKFPKEYSMYSWKHTGVVEHYKSGAKIKWLQKQCRHHSIEMTDKYLKDLGLFENDDILNNAPEI